MKTWDMVKRHKVAFLVLAAQLTLVGGSKNVRDIELNVRATSHAVTFTWTFESGFDTSGKTVYIEMSEDNGRTWTLVTTAAASDGTASAEFFSVGKDMSYRVVVPDNPSLGWSLEAVE